MALVPLSKTPKKSFNPARRPSALLLDQIKHLEWAALPAPQRTPGRLPTRTVKTEGEAAERIAQLTALLVRGVLTILLNVGVLLRHTALFTSQR